MSYNLRPMQARDPQEGHRTATTLELLFDLASVVAIAAAAAGLHHAIADDHVLDGIIHFSMAFFAIWWAWMSYTWFASAYDNNDPLFRILSMIMIGGSVIIAAGVDPLFKSLDFTVVVIGYVVMRVPLIGLWLRAAACDPLRRRTCLRYAVGIGLAQALWVSILFLPPLSDMQIYGAFAFGVLLELSIPAWAERGHRTTWHRHHIIERYGLLTIIVLGEVLLAAYIALQGAFGETTHFTLIQIAALAITMMAALWWLYFSDEDHLQSTELSQAMIWGYGHVLIFASAAAIGAGFAVIVDIATDHAEIGMEMGLKAIAIPLALYLFSLWFVRDRAILSGPAAAVLPIFAALVLTTVIVPVGLIGLTGMTLACVIIRSWLVHTSGLRDLGGAS